MRFLFYLFLLFVGTIAKCPTKEQALDCFYKKADTNNDLKISRHELKNAIYSRLPWYKKAGFALFGGIGRVLKDCDYNQYDYHKTKNSGTIASITPPKVDHIN